MNEYKKLLQELEGKRDKAQMELRDLHVKVDVLSEMIWCLEAAINKEKLAGEPTDEKA